MQHYGNHMARSLRAIGSTFSCLDAFLLCFNLGFCRIGFQRGSASHSANKGKHVEVNTGHAMNPMAGDADG